MTGDPAPSSGPGTTAPASEPIARDAPAPAFTGTTLDGDPFHLSELRGRPVIVNFWGPSCEPCLREFPLLAAKAAQYAGEGLVIVGVLMGDPPEPAQAFVTKFGATWDTVIDPDGDARRAYRVLARPQTFFIDRAGILRSIQIGEVIERDFERQYALISR